ncbi:MAG: hypothetical protein A2Y98_00405 [Candidatus Portnoybacteria bacterium RBG_19FT_COMBO_36_7]|uniref:tRNA N6-adenosine threonylcarbamoyltransferase n=1 Tax=Candidatus Portnoybacteria bacterium RBG_19FT_COMBO_36_7 TaxID=1801992 RepID=A0A1G2F787_9BACT|nr:MAG: hypothetical protein A2Y98_00405 [Candidatus Portnoybacteria bacterium RBG_19FT_COMBO_36_7]
MRILAIETSCDETSIAVLQTKEDGDFSILSNIVSSQVAIHAPFGGVVPTLAKREHQKNLTLILKQGLAEAKLLKVQSSKFPPASQARALRAGKVQSNSAKFKVLKQILNREETLFKKLMPFLKKYAKPDIDVIAVTVGPGLEPALWVGVNSAKALACFWDLSIIPVNHVEAHIIANWLKPISGAQNSNARTQNLFPADCLIVSGGHTQLVLMRDFGKYEILGETRDDAAGEAFDKLAKMLNIGYPGGPIVSKLSAQAKKQKLAPSVVEGLKVKLPRPMINSKDYDFSFSGLKTAALYFVKTLNKKTLKKLTPAICAEFQQAAIDVLVSKTIRAAKEYNVKSVLLSGGVAANDLLRTSLEKEFKRFGLVFSVPPKKFCTDNAAMIALTAAKKTKKYNWQEITTEANLRIA